MEGRVKLGTKVVAKIVINVHNGDTHLWVSTDNEDGSSRNFCHPFESTKNIEKEIIKFMKEIEPELLKYIDPPVDYVEANFVTEYRYDGCFRE